MEMTKDLRKPCIAVLFGGRSGEHEVSLMSARSVLSVIDRDRYNVIEIGITHSGAWLTGINALAAFEQGKTETLFPASLLPDPTRPGLVVLEKQKNNSALAQRETTYAVDVFFPGSSKFPQFPMVICP